MSTPESCLVALQRSVTPDELWTAAHALMRTVVPGRYYILGLPSIGIMPMFLRSTMPMRDRVRFAELAPLNRVLATRPGLTVARMSDFYTPRPGDPFYEEFLVPDGWLHSAAMMFWDRNGAFVGHLASLRSAEQGDYTKAELAQLRRLHPHVHAAVKRLLHLQHSAATQITLEHSLHALPLPIVIVAWDLSVSFANKAGAGALLAWRHGIVGGRALKVPKLALPDVLRSTLEELKTAVSESLRTLHTRSMPREVTVAHPAEPALQATIRLVEPPASRAMHPSWIIHFDTELPHNEEVSHALHQFTKLSPAERQIALLAAAGHGNDSIAGEIGRSRSTVRTHMRNVFRKLGITSRSRLAPMLQMLKPGAHSPM